MIDKPSEVFDRDWEWRQLSQFVSDPQAGASLGIVSGRRRQGKTFLLQSICEATGGFYFGAIEAVPRAEALRQLADALAEYTDASAPPRLDSWAQAIDALLVLGRKRAVPVVLDEFPYLVRESPDLPSVIQQALAPRRTECRESRSRILLCGSSISFMGRLLSGSAPLRGRAALDLTVPTFDYRTAASFWRFRNHRLAALVYFVVGGTPAYRTEYLRGAAPTSLADFDRWVVEHVLSPASPLFREVRSLLAEDPNLRDTGLYTTVLAAVADGQVTRGGIASRLERKATDISHHLTVLQDAGFLAVEPDAFRANRSEYRITEPLVRFNQVVIRPRWAQLERVRPGRTRRVWESSRQAFLAKVAGPVFERICRVWTEDMAAPESVGGEAERALSGTVYDPARRTSHEVDVAVLGASRRVHAIGEVKWTERIGLEHLERLEHIAAILAARDSEPAVLCLFSGTTFTPELRRRASRSGGRVQLVDLERLYAGE